MKNLKLLTLILLLGACFSPVVGQTPSVTACALPAAIAPPEIKAQVLPEITPPTINTFASVCKKCRLTDITVPDSTGQLWEVYQTKSGKLFYPVIKSGKWCREYVTL